MLKFKWDIVLGYTYYFEPIDYTRRRRRKIKQNISKNKPAYSK